MKLGILMVTVGGFNTIVGVWNHHLVLCGSGILILILATLRIRAIRNRAKATSEESEES